MRMYNPAKVALFAYDQRPGLPDVDIHIVKANIHMDQTSMFAGWRWIAMTTKLGNTPNILINTAAYTIECPETFPIVIQMAKFLPFDWATFSMSSHSVEIIKKL